MSGVARASSAGRRLAGRMIPVAALLLATGCAYFNGIYNAREEEKRADRLARRGDEASAAAAYLAAAQKAETVLARHGKSRWRDDALYLAGRGAALAGECERGEARLREYLVLPEVTPRTRARAELALGVCDVTGGRLREARARLASLMASKDEDVARRARLWNARVAIRLGDLEEAARLLQGVDAGVAQWELAAASLDAGAWTRAESLLTQRAIRGDWRDAAADYVSQLWAAGQDSAALRLARRWARAGTPVRGKVHLHLRLGDLALASGRDSLAAEHLREAQRLSTDATIDRESAARLLVVRVAEVDSLHLVDDALRTSLRTNGETTTYTRLASSALLVHMLVDRGQDSFGTGWFLAAEVARDSLRNARIAHRFFRRVADSVPTSPMASTALLAAALLVPDSAERYRERIRQEFADTPAGYLLAGRDPAELPTWRFMDEQFRARWAFVTRLHRDSLARLRPAVPGSGAPGGQADTRVGQVP